MAKNILPKHWNGSEFEELHIVTKASNVFTNDNKSVQQKIDDFTSHLAEDATQAHLAKNIGIEDAEGHFTGLDLETVLNELFTFANDGKTSIADVIGYPATSGDTFEQLKNHIQTNKNTLAINLTNKGQTASGTDTLAALVAKVANIITGKQWASGSALASGWYLTVTGLPFKPKTIIVRRADSSTTFTFYNGDMMDSSIYRYVNVDGDMVAWERSDPTIYDDGFSIVVRGYDLLQNWLAIE